LEASTSRARSEIQRSTCKMGDGAWAKCDFRGPPPAALRYLREVHHHMAARSVRALWRRATRERAGLINHGGGGKGTDLTPFGRSTSSCLNLTTGKWSFRGPWLLKILQQKGNGLKPEEIGVWMAARSELGGACPFWELPRTTRRNGLSNPLSAAISVSCPS